MDQILSLRPFVPARDFALSQRFYAALGFSASHVDEHIAILKQGSFSFILQNFYHEQAAEHVMVQLLVRDADAWWRQYHPEQLVSEFAVKPPRPPTMQDWGMKVGFIFDPSGVLWHVAEVPF